VAALFRLSPRPILAVPAAPAALARPLLAYDGSPKAREALFVATYLAEVWRVPLAVVAVRSAGRPAERLLAEAQRYLEIHEVEAALIEAGGPAPGAILAAAREQESDLLILGGYGGSPVVAAVLGSTVNAVLARAAMPVLVCR
jgi:nucleotide-binding universal stress UspA family protein